MDLSGRRTLAADRQTAWRALNDPQVLRRAIPGCESLERAGDSEYAASVAAAIGPVRARFRGKLRLEDVDEPNGYTLRFEGDGGPAGFAKGVAHVKLSDDGPGTLLEYTVSSQIGGRLAQVGNRLVDSVARKLAEEFFAAFERELGPAPAVAAPKAPPPRPWLTSPWTWVTLFFVALALLLALRLTLR